LRWASLLSPLSPGEPVSAVVTGGGGGAAGERRPSIRHRVLVTTRGQSGSAHLHLVNGHTDCDAGNEDSQPGDLSSETGHFSLHVDSFL